MTFPTPLVRIVDFHRKIRCCERGDHMVLKSSLKALDWNTNTTTWSYLKNVNKLIQESHTERAFNTVKYNYYHLLSSSSSSSSNCLSQEHANLTLNLISKALNFFTHFNWYSPVLWFLLNSFLVKTFGCNISALSAASPNPLRRLNISSPDVAFEPFKVNVWFRRTMAHKFEVTELLWSPGLMLAHAPNTNADMHKTRKQLCAAILLIRTRDETLQLVRRFSAK